MINFLLYFCNVLQCGIGKKSAYLVFVHLNVCLCLQLVTAKGYYT